MKIVAIVQARMGSTRLPGKVMKKIGEKPLIEILIERLSASQEINEIVLATSDDERNLPLIKHVESLGYRVVVGSERDVLDRYFQAARLVSADVVVRITGDCPLVDANLVDAAIKIFRNQKVDYLSNDQPPSFPDGLDIEVFTFRALERASQEAKKPYDREHVTPYIRENIEFHRAGYAYHDDYSSLRWTVDEPADLSVIEKIFAHFSPDRSFGWEKVLKLQYEKPEIFMENANIPRNQGAIMSTGQKLWKRAKKVIPGGNMLLSKRSEMFLPDQWPSYYSKAKGCRVWDLDGREYLDMSIMGIGTNVLGYGHPEVDEAVMKAVQSGNMATLNCPEEVYLAEKLVELHPWAEMARFARSGGEANAIAIRIARAYTGKNKVAICGYHGWHDWYLSANLGDDKGLDGHLLPGLQPNGVPRELRGTVLPFNYNNYQELEDLFKSNEIGAVMMEVSRNFGPEDDFLVKVRALTASHGSVLIFDECSSGFRETFGGLHKKYGVDPDMAMFGKALGNGYAITATIGRREIMEAAQSTFISSTFWTERIGPTAALKTLEVMEKTRSWKMITETGKKIQKGWMEMGGRYGLPISVGGLPALCHFSIDSKDWLSYKTLITQEMLKKGILAGNSVYVCTEHTQATLDEYFEKLDGIFSLISDCENGKKVSELLNGGICHAGFKRLN